MAESRGERRAYERCKTAEQVSEELGGLISARGLRWRARAGKVPGAFKIGRRIFFAWNTSSWLINDLSATSPGGYSIRVPREGSEVDGYFKPAN